MDFFNNIYCGFLLFVAAAAGPFNYDPTDPNGGTYSWGKVARQCDGKKQSPINIDTRSVLYGRPFAIQYAFRDARLRGKFTNNGHCPSFTTEAGYKLTNVPYLENEEFELYNFHFHFGRFDNEGSEHRVNGEKYSGEFHMVHFNTKYGSYENSVNYPDGRVVVAVFFQSGVVSNRPHMDIFLRTNLPRIQPHGAPIDVLVAPISLLPESSDIYTYAGSTTTPPCRENIRWIVHRQPVVISKDVIKFARKVQDASGYPQGKFGNFRPVQSLNNRVVEANFLPYRPSSVLAPLSTLLRQ